MPSEPRPPDTADQARPDAPVVAAEAVVLDGTGASAGDATDAPAADPPVETVEHPAKVIRIASMIKQLLEEVRHAPLDEAGRSRLREIYKTSVRELAASMSPDLREELARVTLPFAEGDAPSEPELRIAQAQLVGWLDGLFHGIQATLFAQQMAARTQLEGEGQRGLPPAPDPRMGPPRPPGYL